jgi:23S rRNA pseudouridine1911/1915/1917 synthase
MQTLINKFSNNIRLDNFLVDSLNKQKSFVNKLIKQKIVKVNNEIIEKNGHRIKLGDEIVVGEYGNNIFHLKPSNVNVKIIYEDDYLLVIEKPKNMLVHPTSFCEQNTLINILLPKIKTDEFEDKYRPGVVHRLDRNTTGLLVVAKNYETYKLLIKQINEKKIIRKYLTLVHHCFKDDHLMLKLPIIRSKTHISKMTISDDSDAKVAITEVNVLKNFKYGALIECILHTGRTHQIRAHLSYIHHPVFNDSLYGMYDGYKNYEQFLHAYYLSFFHPYTNKLMEFSSEPDSTFMLLKEKLDKRTHV